MEVVISSAPTITSSPPIQTPPCSSQCSSVLWRISPISGGTSSNLPPASATSGSASAFKIPKPLKIPIRTLSLTINFYFNYAHNALEEEEEEAAGKYHRELVTMGALKWRRDSGWAELPRYAQKVSKIAKVRMVSPRTIQQPR